MMEYEVNKIRIFRDICKECNLSLGAIGVLSYIFFNSDKYPSLSFKQLSESSNDTNEDLSKYLTELINDGYINSF